MEKHLILFYRIVAKSQANVKKRAGRVIGLRAADRTASGKKMLDGTMRDAAE